MIGLLVAPAAEAGRKMMAPPYMRRIIFDFNTTTPPPPAEGQKIGNMMTVALVLSNLSTIAQSGTLKLSGSAGGFESGRPTPASYHASLCADSTSGSDAGMPGPVSFSIGPGGTVSYFATVFFHSEFHAAGPTGNSLFDATFTPSIEISID